MKRVAVYEARHTVAPKPRPLADVIAETAAFSVLVAQTKRGNPNAVALLGELFGQDALGNQDAA